MFPYIAKDFANVIKHLQFSSGPNVIARVPIRGKQEIQGGGSRPARVTK
jgi:hypothetical protein